MKRTAQKFMRDNMQTQIQKQMKALYPNFEFEHQFLRLPIQPKIIVYSNLASVDRFISQIFPVFKFINPKASSESDEAFTRQIATELVYPEGDMNATGVVVHGFPFNTTQALLLDKYINGVNLALHIKSGQDSSDYESLLKYYGERGSLLELEYKQFLSAQEVAGVQEKVKMALKSSE